MREALVDTNLYSSVTIDASMKAINPETDIPDSLIKAYYTMLQNGVKVRTSIDVDYEKVKGSGRFEHLDKMDKKWNKYIQSSTFWKS